MQSNIKNVSLLDSTKTTSKKESGLDASGSVRADEMRGLKRTAEDKIENPNKYFKNNSSQVIGRSDNNQQENLTLRRPLVTLSPVEIEQKEKSLSKLFAKPMSEEDKKRIMDQIPIF